MLYLKRRVKSKITPKILENVLKRIGVDMEIVETTGLSYTNDVYKLNKKGTTFYLKFFTDQWCDQNAGIREVEALKFLRSEGIPVPEIVLFGKDERVSPRNFALLTPARGMPLIKMLHQSIDEKIISSSLEILTRFSELRGNFGFFQHDSSIHRSYNHHLNFINDILTYAYKKLTDLGYDVHCLPDLFSKWDNEQDSGRYVFCHNDFTPKHVFVDGSEITGLIDFEWSVFSEKISDPVQWLISLAEYEVDIKHLQRVYDYITENSNLKTANYYAARMLVLCAAWPHKNIHQPNYSQTCLDKAERILKEQKIVLESLIWEGGSGVLGVEK